MSQQMLTLAAFLLIKLSFGHGLDRGEVVALQKDGKIIVAGVANQKNGDIILVRSDANGQRELSFGKKGIVRTDLGGKEQVYGLVIQPDQRILISGYTEKEGTKEIFVVRYLPEGNLDPSFGINGRTLITLPNAAPAEAHYMALQKDNKIVVAGFYGGPDFYRVIVFRFNREGGLERTFLTPFSQGGKAYGLALQDDGKIVVAGSTYYAETGEDCAVVRFLSNGRLDKNFGDRGLARVKAGPGQDVCSCVKIQPDGKIIAGGFSTQEKRRTDFLLARLLPNGQPDATLNGKGWVTTDFAHGFDLIHALAITKDGILLAAGEASGRWALVRYKDFLSPEIKRYGKGSAEEMSLQPNGDILLTGFLRNHLGLVRIQNHLDFSRE